MNGSHRLHSWQCPRHAPRVLASPGRPRKWPVSSGPLRFRGSYQGCSALRVSIFRYTALQPHLTPMDATMSLTWLIPCLERARYPLGD